MQQVVEILCDAASELADRFELLRLEQRLLGADALADLLRQARIGIGEVLSAYRDEALQLVAAARQSLARLDDLADLGTRAQPFGNLGGGVELVAGLREGDIKCLLARRPPGLKELQAQGGLAGSRRPFHQVQPALDEAAGQNVIERRYPR